MVNPFQKRASEYLRDDEAFLAVVTPEPLATFLQGPAKEERLYDRLVMIIGTPGSGKTTLARLFEFTTLRKIVQSPHLDSYRSLVDILTSCRAIDSQYPALIGGRIPLEAEYREFWEFPYPEELRTRLMTKLLQARAVLVWLRHMQEAGIPLDAIEMIPRTDAHGAVEATGGRSGTTLQDRARNVELAIYRIAAALVPPSIGDLDSDATGAYAPFDVIDAFRFPGGDRSLTLRPLIMLDDAHSLHPDQWQVLRRWFVRRELTIARWVLTRLDTLSSADVLVDPTGGAGGSGVKPSREMTVIRMQGAGDRKAERKAFRKMAKGMAKRYLRQMDTFSRRGLQDLEYLMSTTPTELSAARRRQLSRHVDGLQRQFHISNARREEFEQLTSEYFVQRKYDERDVRLAILSILLHRYAKRAPQLTLFGGETREVEPKRPMGVEARIADGARIHLLHQYDRPYYFGMDALCDASGANAEQFLQLASRLVAQSEMQLVRRRNDPTLTSDVQDRLLRSRATKLIEEWDFPQCGLVRRLANGIAERCLTRSLEGNAPLGGGASALGILQSEFDSIPDKNPDLARVIKFGIAYNAFELVPKHRAKNQTWCLIELSGVLLLHFGLTLKRGGFVEGSVTELQRLLRRS